MLFAVLQAKGPPETSPIAAGEPDEVSQMYGPPPDWRSEVSQNTGRSQPVDATPAWSLLAGV
jgi:hypothetical protein